jgi:hypothetical protein
LNTYIIEFIDLVDYDSIPIVQEFDAENNASARLGFKNMFKKQGFIEGKNYKIQSIKIKKNVIPKIKIEYVKQTKNGYKRVISDNPIKPFKTFISSKSRNKDLIYVEVENKAGEIFDMCSIMGKWNETYGETYAYNLFLQQTYLADYFEILNPNEIDILKLKEAPLRTSPLSEQYF